MSVPSDFKLVVNKKRQKKVINQEKLNQLLSTLSINVKNDVCEEKLFHKITKISEEMKTDDYFRHFSKCFSKLDLISNLNSSSEDSKLCVICYGLGSFRQESIGQYISQYQLGFLIAFQQSCISPVRQWLIFDPIFNLEEKNVLKRFNFKLIENDEQAKRLVEEPTLFFMPHCDKELYNNLLWTNWSKKCLNNLIILGNSFNHLIDSMSVKRAQEEYVYILNAIELNLVQEQQLENCFKFNWSRFSLLYDQGKKGCFFHQLYN